MSEQRFRYHVVAYFKRYGKHSRLKGSSAIMYCGIVKKDANDGVFGYRHIKDGHQSEFAYYGSFSSTGGWASFMEWIVGWVLNDPSRQTVQSSTRFCYVRNFTFLNANGDEFDLAFAVILGTTGQRIIMAFPAYAGVSYCKGTAF